MENDNYNHSCFIRNAGEVHCTS
ncbi:MAG TPA: hypothetical protein IGS53_10940 [Leptolyngbyaceae cyanobacterium M33_DOE_097]|nr:hypothetical protein [Leptolyngbyaceae cyanobacterium M33_DOE_097]